MSTQGARGENIANANLQEFAPNLTRRVPARAGKISRTTAWTPHRLSFTIAGYKLQLQEMEEIYASQEGWSASLPSRPPPAFSHRSAWAPNPCRFTIHRQCFHPSRRDGYNLRKKEYKKGRQWDEYIHHFRNSFAHRPDVEKGHRSMRCAELLTQCDRVCAL